MIFSKLLASTTKVLVGAAICLGAIATPANAACQAGTAGCVLPVADPLPPPPAAPVVVQDYEEPKSMGILPILAGVALAGLLLWLLLDDDDDDDEDLPISP